MISDMKNRIERDIRNSDFSSSKNRNYTPMRSAERRSAMFNGNEDFSVMKQRESLTVSPPPNKRDTLMHMSATPTGPVDGSAWKQAVAPLIRPKASLGQQVEYVYLSTFDPVQNDHVAKRSVQENSCYMGAD